MKAVVTRVKNARVEIDNKVNGAIEKGFLVLLGVGPDDTEAAGVQLFYHGHIIPRVKS